MKKKNKTKIKNQIDLLAKQDEYKPIHFGDARVTSFQMSGLVNTFCMCSEWPNGEGFNFDFESEKESKKISLHFDEIEVMLACLNKLNFFDND